MKNLHSFTDGRCSTGSFLRLSSTAMRNGLSGLIFGLSLFLGVTSVSGAAFNTSNLSGATLSSPTNLDFGPDGRLYVAELEGLIKVFTISRDAPNTYSVIDAEVIDLVQNIQNYNDDGTLHAVQKRQITGIYVTGTAGDPVLYVNSSDYRQGGDEGATDTNLDTNSGMLSRLTRNAQGDWEKVDLVRGLPRSEENHAPNGIALDEAANKLYFASGGNTNAGAPSNNFAFFGETALAAAILEVDLAMLDAMPILGVGNESYIYDLPTVDDPDRPNVGGADPFADVGDPFGGNDGLNQAVIDPTGPVQVYAPGFRNAFDMVITHNGRMYTIDNGGNPGWGGHPVLLSGTDVSTASNVYLPSEPGSTAVGQGLQANGIDFDPIVGNFDNLHYIPGPGYYGGHPNPIRANPATAGWYTFDNDTGIGLFRDEPSELPANWPPVPVELANPVEGDFRQPGLDDGALYTWNSSTNGMAEYKATNFGGELVGALLTVSYDGVVSQINLNETGDQVESVTTFAQNFGIIPLDVTTQGDDEAFPGVVAVVNFISNSVTFFEPADFDGGVGTPCVGAPSDEDEDGDGFTNNDEIANGTNPCNPADKPSDFDGDNISDLLDDDDDNDGYVDLVDFFQIDSANGHETTIPLVYEMLNANPGFGFFGLGFTGLMTDYVTDYNSLYNTDQLIAGGTSGLLTIGSIDAGDAYELTNTQRNAFQFGVRVDQNTQPFQVEARFASTNIFKDTVLDHQTIGFYIGNGDQDNYLLIGANANAGTGGIRVLQENDGVIVSDTQYNVPAVLTAVENFDLYLQVDPAAGTAQALYSTDGGVQIPLGTPVVLSGKVLKALQGGYSSLSANSLAIGLLATSNPRDSGNPPEGNLFTGDLDFMSVTYLPEDYTTRTWETITTTNTVTARHDHAFVAWGDELIILGGRGTDKPVEHFDIATATWSDGPFPPLELHDIRPVVYDGLIYILGGSFGPFPVELGIPNVLIYNPATRTWHEGPEIPPARQRGSGAMAVYQDHIYVVAGNTFGHGNGVETTVGWVDKYDPVTGTFTELPDVPNPRDHATVVEADGKLYLYGGRVGGDPDYFNANVAEVDVFDLATETWETLPPSSNLPNPRGGLAGARLGQKLLAVGGENAVDAFAETAALDLDTLTWSLLDDLNQKRHATTLAVVEGVVFVAAGSGFTGGSPELDSVEAFSDGPYTPPTPAAVIPSQLEAHMMTLDLGAIAIGESGTADLILSNVNGEQGIVIESIEVKDEGDFSFVSPVPLPFVLPPGFDIAIEVTLAPTDEFAKNGRIEVGHSASASVLDVALTGNLEGPPPPDLIEILINAGGPEVSFVGETWLADQFAVGGDEYIGQEFDVLGTTKDELYWSEHYGTSFAYSVPVPNGTYDVELHFAEIWWGVRANQNKNNVGKRVFDFTVEGGQASATSFDIIAASGLPGAAHIETLAGIEVADGMLDVSFTAQVDNAKVSALRIIQSGPLVLDPPNLSVDPTTAVFPGAVVGKSPTNLDLTLTNTGEEPLIIESITVSEPDAYMFTYAVDLPLAIAPGASSVLPVTFTPDVLGNAVALMQIVHNGVTGTDIVSLSGEGLSEPPPGQLNADVTEVTFAPVFLGQSSSAQTVTVTNSGGQNLTVTSLQITGTDSAAFAAGPVAGTLPVVLAPTESLAIDVTFTATGLGSLSATLEVIHDGANANPVVTLTGTGEEEPIILPDPVYYNAGGPTYTDPNGVTWLTDDGLSTGGSVFNVGGIGITGTVSDVTYRTERWGADLGYAVPVDPGIYTVEIHLAEIWWGVRDRKNQDNTGVRVFDIFVEGELAFAAVDISAAVGPKTAYVLTLSGLPITDGTLDISFGPIAENPKISGIAIQAEAPVDTRTLSTDTIAHDFGQVDLGTTSPAHTVTLTNSGSLDVTITDIALGGTEALDYGLVVADTLPVTLLAGETTTFDVEFSPSTIGTRSATITVTHDGDNAPTVVAFTGLGFEFIPIKQLEADVSSVDFGDVVFGETSAPQIVTLTNTGNVSLTVNDLSLTGTDVATFDFAPTAVSPVVLQPLESTTVQVTFSPSTIALYSAALVATHDGDNADVEVALAGNGVAPPPPDPIRYNVGGPEVVASAGTFLADPSDGSDGSIAFSNVLLTEIAGTDDDGLFLTERTMNTSGTALVYNVPVPESFTYTVTLYFSELFYGAPGYGSEEVAGSRTFAVSLEGSTVTTGLDVLATAGAAATAVTQSFEVDITDGTLEIVLTPDPGMRPTLSAVEIVPVP